MIPDDFWDAREHLARTRQAARARRAGPDAVLLAGLVRIASQVPPEVVLPPTVGGIASLNTFVAIVGPSGGGKGAAQAAAEMAVPIADPDPVKVESLGSGEGLARSYMHRPSRTGPVEQHTESVVFDVAEVDSLLALTARTGATVGSELRKVWSAERLGFSYVDPVKRLPVPAHRYRAGLVVGVQPARAEWLLDGVGGGLPQRFLWAGAGDPDAPDRPPAEPDIPLWLPPGVSFQLNGRMPGGAWPRIQLPVCEAARKDIDRHRLVVLRQDEQGLDGHALLVRLKVAALLALWAGYAKVEEEDWQLAELVVKESAQVRARVAADVADLAATEDEQRGIRDARRRDAADEHRYAATMAAALKHAWAHRPPGGCTIRCLQAAVSKRQRTHLIDALAQLVDAGQLDTEVRKAPDKPMGDEYRYWWPRGNDDDP